MSNSSKIAEYALVYVVAMTFTAILANLVTYNHLTLLEGASIDLLILFFFVILGFSVLEEARH